MAEFSRSRLPSGAQAGSNGRKDPFQPFEPMQSPLKLRVTKQAFLDEIGDVEPIIQRDVEGLLSRLDFKTQTKEEIYNSLVNDIHQKVEEISRKRVKFGLLELLYYPRRI